MGFYPMFLNLMRKGFEIEVFSVNIVYLEFCSF